MRMANTDVRLPPDIIRAIEKSLSSTGKVVVKMHRGTIKVQKETISLVLAVEI